MTKSRTLNEKDVVLKIGLKVQELEQAGYKVVMTRNDGSYIELSKRPAGFGIFQDSGSRSNCGRDLQVYQTHAVKIMLG